MATATDDEDDPIVEEIDVYLAKGLADKLYLFQYPVRPAGMTYEGTPHLATRIKPKLHKVELELGINVTSPNYSRSKGEQIALNVDGAHGDDGSGSCTYSTKLMDKQLLCSSQTPGSASRYAIALYRRGELHVTPLQGVLQLRPSFSYLDKADSKHKDKDAAQDGDSSQEEAEDDVKQVTVRFARPESDRAKQRRMQSYEYMQQKQAEEPWFNLRHHGLKDGRADHERQYLLAQSGMMEACELMKTPKEYLSMLMPPAKEETIKVTVAPSNVMSMAQLRTLPLGDQVKTLMKNVKVLQFSQLMSLLSPGLDSVSVLRSVQQVALLVQGCWVVKSEVLYPKDSLSPHSGIPGELLCRARDFVMWRFTQERMLLRKDVAGIVKLPPDDVREIFQQVAVSRIGLGWEFMQPRDDDFVRRHADVVQRQTMLWAGVQARLEKAYGLKKEDMLPKKPEAPPLGAVVTGEERLRLARSKIMEHKEDLEQTYKQRHSQNPTRQTHNAVQESGGVRIKEERASDAEDTEPMDVDSSNGAPALANGEHGAPGESESEAAGAETQRRELLAFVRARLAEHTVLPLRELRRLLDRHLAALAPGHVLGAGISPLMLQEAALQSGGRQIHVQIPPQFLSDANNDKVFANWSVGDAHEKPRQVLLEMFNENYRLKRPAIQSRLALAGGPEPDKPTLDKLLKECCVSRNGMWYLKGTTPS
ncbi:DNA-directed RNA polymerase III subunit RPC5 [Lampetra fluviatilis]